MTFLVYIIVLFSFFHWLVGFGIVGSLFASVLALILSPLIWAAVAAATFFIWAAILGLVAWVCGTFAYLFK